MGIEDPDADVVEQQRTVDDLDDDPAVDATADPDGLPAEADPADVAEQRMIVPQDIDEP